MAKTVGLVDKLDWSNLWALCPFSLPPARRDKLKQLPDFKLGTPIVSAIVDLPHRAKVARFVSA